MADNNDNGGMAIRKYTLRFLTPAFLGDAEQSGAWRTPPIKALLRQWWRVAYAAGRHPDERSNARFVADMRREEGQLFGVAADKDGDSRQSQIRMRLSRWVGGELKSWDKLEQPAVYHPETEKTQYKVGPHAYLGYGPLDGRGGTKLSKPKAAIQSDEESELKLAFPAEHASTLDSALWLMDRYGALGGRSRNGWGSFALLRPDSSSLPGALHRGLTRSWNEALTLDWPHAIGTAANGPLIWATDTRSDWQSVMRLLAQIKIGLRTQFAFTPGRNAAQPEARHWLSYPITNHNVDRWKERGKGDYRLPNSLRLKVRKHANGGFQGAIFHVPCLPPEKFSPNLGAVSAVWQSVHGLLDELCEPAGNRRYLISNAKRHAELKSSLDSLFLTRIPA